MAAPRGQVGCRQTSAAASATIDTGEDGQRAEDPEIPLLVRGADERAEHPTRRAPSAGANGQASEPSHGIVRTTSTPSVVRSAQRARESREVTGRQYGCRGPPVARGDIGAGHRDDDPGHRILEESAVRERMHEEREQDGAQREAESRFAPPNALDHDGRSREEAKIRQRAPAPRAPRPRSAASCARRTGVGEPPCSERAWLSAGCAPRPTPTSGWSRITSTVDSTRRERSLVTWRARPVLAGRHEAGRA